MKRLPKLSKRQQKLMRGDRSQVSAGHQLARRGLAVVDGVGRITITLRGQAAMEASAK